MNYYDYYKCPCGRRPSYRPHPIAIPRDGALAATNQKGSKERSEEELENCGQAAIEVENGDQEILKISPKIKNQTISCLLEAVEQIQLGIWRLFRL